MISINYRDPRPIYAQVRDGFQQLIISGVLTPDSRMPSVRELAAELAINPNTIQRAYRELEAEGYIFSVPGRGSFVSDGKEAAEAKKAALLDEFRKLARELEANGISRDEMISVLEGENKK